MFSCCLWGEENVGLVQVHPFSEATALRQPASWMEASMEFPDLQELWLYLLSSVAQKVITNKAQVHQF